MKRITGYYEKYSIAGEEVAAFVPKALPPSNPDLVLDEKMAQFHAQAEHSLARLELAGEMVPSIDWFIYAFVRKEAVTSSQIEGTQASLVDLFTFEASAGSDDAPTADIAEICNYLDAVKYAQDEILREGGLPISMRLLNETHRRLMKGVRGQAKQPGKVRTTQNWIGGTRPGNAVFVPTPPQMLGVVLSDFEKYIHTDTDLPALIQAAFLHVQFETIHPYLDGNGRLGRLLITLLFEAWGLLSRPLLYLSLYFKRHRSEYYRLLGAVRTKGDWESWTAFFLKGVGDIADEAVEMARNLSKLVSKDRNRVVSDNAATVASLKLFESLPLHPIITPLSVVKLLDTTKPTANKAIRILEKLGVLSERTGRKRDRNFGYTAYL